MRTDPVNWSHIAGRPGHCNVRRKHRLPCISPWHNSTLPGRSSSDQFLGHIWATFIAEANTINNDLTAVAGGGTPSTGSVASLITEIQNYEKYVVGFDNSQGGTFGARFDNELLLGTVNADTKAAVAGLTGIMNGDTGAALAADQAEIGGRRSGFCRQCYRRERQQYSDWWRVLCC
jgi:hypothetical protein